MSDRLTIADVMERYDCSRQTASKIMKKALGFRIGRRLYVRERDLDEYESSCTEYPPIVPRTRKAEITRIPRRKTA